MRFKGQGAALTFPGLNAEEKIANLTTSQVSYNSLLYLTDIVKSEYFGILQTPSNVLLYNFIRGDYYKRGINQLIYLLLI